MILALLACGTPCADDELLLADGSCWGRGNGSQTSDDTGDSSTSSWTTLPGSCEAPGDLPDDPLQWVGYDKKGQDNGESRFMEFTDLLVDGDRIITVGQGGLLTYDISDPTAPEFLEWYPESGEGGPRFHRLELLDDGLLATSTREQGLHILSDGGDGIWTEVSLTGHKGLEGLLWYEDLLYTTVRGEGLVVYELSDPADPSVVTTVAGPETAWMLSDEVDGWTYAADNSGGLVPIDLSDPENPVVHSAVDVGGAALHVEATSDHLYVSTGGYGVRILERSTPELPTEVVTVPTGGSVLMTSVEDDTLWAADHIGVVVFDVSDPSEPKPLAREISEQFALAVDASGDIGWVGDWNYLSAFQLDRSVSAGELQIANSELLLPLDGGEVEIGFSNLGAGELEIVGASIGDERVEIQVDRTTLASGDAGTLRLSYEGGDELNSTLCLATTDPDGPVIEIPVLAGDHHAYLGQPAPDFVLDDIPGNSHQLSEELGRVVVLVFFAPW